MTTLSVYFPFSLLARPYRLLRYFVFQYKWLVQSNLKNARSSGSSGSQHLCLSSSDSYLCVDVWVGPSTSSNWAHGFYSILRPYPPTASMQSSQLQAFFSSTLASKDEVEGVPYTFVMSNAFANIFLLNFGQLGIKAPPRDYTAIIGDGISTKS